MSPILHGLEHSFRKGSLMAIIPASRKSPTVGRHRGRVIPRWQALVVVLALVAQSLALMVLSPRDQAAASANFAVTSTSDLPDTSPGDGTCLTVAGTCTLRAAIQEANALHGTHVIQVPAGTYALTLVAGVEIDPPDPEPFAICTEVDSDAHQGDLDITCPVSIIGAGAEHTVRRRRRRRSPLPAAMMCPRRRSWSLSAGWMVLVGPSAARRCRTRGCRSVGTPSRCGPAMRRAIPVSRCRSRGRCRRCLRARLVR